MLIKKNELDLKKDLVIKKDLCINGETLKPGSPFLWKKINITIRRVQQLFALNYICHTDYYYKHCKKIIPIEKPVMKEAKK